MERLQTNVGQDRFPGKTLLYTVHFTKEDFLFFFFFLKSVVLSKSGLPKGRRWVRYKDKGK